MKNSCIPHPPREPVVLIRPWQVEACQGNLCAAALLNYFEYWHNIKLDQQGQARSLNDVAEKHGDARSQDESLLQWHTVEELRAGLLGLYGRNLILTAVKQLETLGFVSIQQNPNPSYKWDKTNHYLFHPEVVITWLRANRGLDQDYSPVAPVKSDSLKINHREVENKPSIVEKGTIDATETKPAISVITTEITPENTLPHVSAHAETSPPPDGGEDMRVLPEIPQPSDPGRDPPLITIDEVVDGWNDICGSEGLPVKTDIGRKNKNFREKIKRRIHEHPERDFWQRVLNNAWRAGWSNGQNKNGWKATLHWAVETEVNLIKLYEAMP